MIAAIPAVLAMTLPALELSIAVFVAALLTIMMVGRKPKDGKDNKAKSPPAKDHFNN